MLVKIFGLSLGLERLIDASYLFANTTYTKLPKTLRTYYTNNMAYMFYNCKNLKNISNFTLSKYSKYGKYVLKLF